MCSVDPDVMVFVYSPLDENITAGVNNTLSCMIDDIDDLMLPVEYMWWHFNGNDTKLINNKSGILSLSPLKLSDAGEYMCQVNISSSLLNSDLIFYSMMPHVIRVFGKGICLSVTML